MEVEPEVRQFKTMLMVVQAVVWQNKVVMLIHTQGIKVLEERHIMERQVGEEFTEAFMAQAVVAGDAVQQDRILPTPHL